MARVLILTFESQPGSVGDGAGDAARILAETWQGSAEIVARDLIPAFTESSRRLRASIAKHLPDAVLIVATRPDARAVTVERLAVNLDDAPAPDAHGTQPVDAPIVAGAPAALWTTLPARDIVDALGTRGLPAELSVNAGTGLANHVFYVLQRELVEWGVPSGLLQLPPTQAASRGALALPVEVLAEALRTAVETIVGEQPAEEPEPEPEPTPEPYYDPAATQPFLMPIQEPIAEDRSAVPVTVAPTLAALPIEEPYTPQVAAPPSLPPAAGRPEPQSAETMPHWGPTSGELPAVTGATPAPAKEPASASAPAPKPDTPPVSADKSEKSAVRHPTWDEIISGKSKG